MNRFSYRWVAAIMFAVISMQVLMLFIGNYSSDAIETAGPKNYLADKKTGVQEVGLSSNDFSFKHPCSKIGAIEHISLQSRQVEKLIRKSIFAPWRIYFLTQTLKWFIHPVYIQSLSPIWRPSIPIAHRKLTI